MTANTIVGVESAIGAATTVRKGHITATPDQAAGYPATEILDESPATSWRTTDTDRDNSRALIRLGRRRAARTFAGLEHNLGRHGLWRLTADDDYAIRPAASFDGVDDHGVATGFASAADLTVISRVRLRNQPTDNNVNVAQVWELYNAAGRRARVFLFAGNHSTSPWLLGATVDNYGAATTLASATAPTGQWVDVAVRYRGSDDRCALSIAGVEVASGTATAWADNGADDVRVGSYRTGSSLFGRLEMSDLAIYNRYLTDAEISAYRASELTGAERGLAGSWHFLEGSGTTVADSKAAAAMTLTGATWVERVNHSPRWSSGAREAWGQWAHRQALVLAPGTYATSPVLGSAERSATISLLVRVDADAALVDGGALAWYGPSRADAELLIEMTSAGELRAKSYRGGPFTVTSDAAINDGVTRRVRAVLDGRNNTLDLYLATDGDSAEVAQGTQATGLTAFAVLASCKLEVGDSTAAAEATAAVADVRLYGDVRLEADDDLTRDAAPVDPEMLAHLRLDGSVLDHVDQSRSYTSAAVTYGEISQTATRALGAGNARRVDAGGDPFSRYPRLLVAHASATVEATELYLELWDPDNGDGYISLAVALPQDALALTFGRDYGARRSFRRRVTKRSADGLTSRERGYDADVHAVSLPWILTDTEADDILARLMRRDSDALVLLISDSAVAEHRLVDHAVVGTATAERLTDPAYNRSTIEIEVEAARAAPGIA